MSKYICNACGYVYDPELGDPDNGIAPGTKFEDLLIVGPAHYAALARTCFQRNNHLTKEVCH